LDPAPQGPGITRNGRNRSRQVSRRHHRLLRQAQAFQQALVGILFPPSIIGTAVVGAAVGGAGGHLWRGLSRSDVKELGDVIDSGEAALVIVGESTVQEAVDKAELKAEKQIAKELDVSPKDVDAAIQEAAGEIS
jgi:uncharacterized membrane protein